MVRTTLLVVAVLVGTITATVAPAGAALAADAPADAGPDANGPESVPATIALAGDNASVNESDAPPDPDEDVIGWEKGYWYNESIDVDQSDGLSAAELEQFRARTMARVEKIRNLEFEHDVPIEFVSREEMKEIVRNRNFGKSGRDGIFEALFLIGENEDAETVRATGTGAGVLGFAAEEGSETMVLVTKDPEHPMVTPTTLAHEYVHMLQHQHFNLSRARYQRTTHDGEYGKDAVVEGEATLVHKLYAQRCQGDWNCVDTPEDWADTERGGNWALGFMGYVPYSDGAVWVNSLYESGGWEAVTEAHQSPPTSSEEMIHHREDDRPVELSIEDTARNGWEVRPFDGHRTERLGEVSIFTMFYYQHRTNGVEAVAGEFDVRNRDNEFDTLNYSTDAAEGWGNDRLLVYGNGDERGYVWKTVWDTERDATEFYEAYVSLLEAHDPAHPEASTWVIESGRFADAFRVVQDDKTVTIVNGPTVESLGNIRPGSTDDVDEGTTAVTTGNATSTGASDDPTTTAPSDESTSTEAPDDPATADDEITSTGGDSGSTPGFGAVAAVLGLIAAVAVTMVRRRG
jgi:PGF-CTERM protein